MLVLLDPENMCLDTKIMILSGLTAEILEDTGIYMIAIMKIQDGCHNVSGGNGTYQKWKAKAMGSMWKKTGAFVRNVHIHLKFSDKLPDYKWIWFDLPAITGRGYL